MMYETFFTKYFVQSLVIAFHYQGSDCSALRANHYDESKLNTTDESWRTEFLPSSIFDCNVSRHSVNPHPKHKPPWTRVGKS